MILVAAIQINITVTPWRFNTHYRRMPFDYRYHLWMTLPHYFMALFVEKVSDNGSGETITDACGPSYDYLHSMIFECLKFHGTNTCL